METNLKTEEGRIKAIEKIQISYIEDLIKNNFDFHKFTICEMYDDRFIFGIKYFNKEDENKTIRGLSSIIQVYLKTNNEINLGNKDILMNFSISCSFNPLSKENYWKVIHAATILKNWEKFIEITNKYHKKHLELLDKIFNNK
jgi:hypothetical protein